MLEEGAIKLGIHSLIASSEKERENAVKLLLEFSGEEACCTRIASEKGALVLLSSMAGNMEHPALSNLAEKVLKRMEMVEDNVLQLAVSGRFEPLLVRLCEGTLCIHYVAYNVNHVGHANWYSFFFFFFGWRLEY